MTASDSRSLEASFLHRPERLVNWLKPGTATRSTGVIIYVITHNRESIDFNQKTPENGFMDLQKGVPPFLLEEEGARVAKQERSKLRGPVGEPVLADPFRL